MPQFSTTGMGWLGKMVRLQLSKINEVFPPWTVEDIRTLPIPRSDKEDTCFSLITEKGRYLFGYHTRKGRYLFRSHTRKGRYLFGSHTRQGRYLFGSHTRKGRYSFWFQTRKGRYLFWSHTRNWRFTVKPTITFFGKRNMHCCNCHQKYLFGRWWIISLPQEICYWDVFGYNLLGLLLVCMLMKGWIKSLNLVSGFMFRLVELEKHQMVQHYCSYVPALSAPLASKEWSSFENQFP